MSRWRDWTPPGEPSRKPAGSLIKELFPGTEVDADKPPTEEQRNALALLNRTGGRIVLLESGERVVGVWSDLDGPHIRAALRTLEMDQLPVRYLDGDVPMRYKVRRVAGEPTPLAVLKEMEQHPEPWKLRDQLWKKEKTN